MTDTDVVIWRSKTQYFCLFHSPVSNMSHIIDPMFKAYFVRFSRTIQYYTQFVPLYAQNKVNLLWNFHFYYQKIMKRKEKTYSHQPSLLAATGIAIQYDVSAPATNRITCFKGSIVDLSFRFTSKKKIPKDFSF